MLRSLKVFQHMTSELFNQYEYGYMKALKDMLISINKIEKKMLKKCSVIIQLRKEIEG